MLGNRLNRFISRCHILCLRWLRTNVHAKCIDGYTWADPEGGQGIWTPPPEKSQKYSFFSNMGQSYQASIRCQVIIGTLANDTFWIRAWALYNASVICNHCFTPAPEQDGDIHSLVNVLCFYFFIVPTMWRKCCGLIDIDKQIADYGDELSWFCQLPVPTVWWLLWGTSDTKSKSSTFLWAGAWSQMTSA